MKRVIARESSRRSAGAKARCDPGGLWNGVKGARRCRQVWSVHKMKTLAPAQVSHLAHSGAVSAAETGEVRAAA